MVRSDAKLIGEDFFPLGMTLQLLKNIQKRNLSDVSSFFKKIRIFPILLPKLIRNHSILYPRWSKKTRLEIPYKFHPKSYF